MSVELSNEEISRYSRHLILPEVGMAGQKKLKGTSVLCIGTGGLGSPIAMYLAAAGIGKIGIVDFDVVDYSNLQRQIIHGTADVDRPKVQSGKETLNSINPEVEVVIHETMLTSENALDIIEPYDIVVDGTDNFPTRYLTNDACVLLKKPNVRLHFPFRRAGKCVCTGIGRPCYRCLYPEPPLRVWCRVVLRAACWACCRASLTHSGYGNHQAGAGQGEPLINRLMLYSALDMSFRELKLRRDPKCPICGENPTITELIDYQEFCGLR